MHPKEFTHLSKSDDPTMVDVSVKKVTKRSATAMAKVLLPADTVAVLEDHAYATKKGPVFQTAVLAGIMGAKKTSDLIPLCHPLGLDKCSVDIKINEEKEIEIYCTASLESKTGVEMEALTGASIAALTIYDMCKSFSHDIVISEIKLLEKRGGKSDYTKST